MALLFLFGTLFSIRARNENEMRKQEMFEMVLSFIEEETEVSRSLILSGDKHEEVVDARSLLIIVLSELGFYPSQIAALSGICPRCISPFIVAFGERRASRRMLGIYYERVMRKLRDSMD